MEEQELARQMDRLDPMEVWAPALEADLPTPSWSGWRAAFGSEPSSRSRCLPRHERLVAAPPAWLTSCCVISSSVEGSACRSAACWLPTWLSRGFQEV